MYQKITVSIYRRRETALATFPSCGFWPSFLCFFFFFKLIVFQHALLTLLYLRKKQNHVGEPGRWIPLNSNKQEGVLGWSPRDLGRE